MTENDRFVGFILWLTLAAMQLVGCVSNDAIWEQNKKLLERPEPVCIAPAEIEHVCPDPGEKLEIRGALQDVSYQLDLLTQQIKTIQAQLVIYRLQGVASEIAPAGKKDEPKQVPHYQAKDTQDAIDHLNKLFEGAEKE